MKILIAEDDMTSRAILQALTTKWGYEPVLAEDGGQAWEILQSVGPPLLLLLDWEMPVMNGTDLCRKVRETATENPPFIILLTGRTEKDDIVSGLKAGANDYVSKPFNHAELQARLNVGKRVVQLQQQILHAKDALAAEHEIIEETLLAMHRSKHFDNRHLREFQSPVDKISGDILFSSFRPDGAQHVLLGDFTGHGLNAAIGGPLVSDTFYVMTRKGLEILDIYGEINRHLCEKMPVGLFLCAALIEIDPSRRKLRLLNCGMQDILLFRGQEEKCRITSQNLPLGIADAAPSDVTELAVEKEDRVLVYSDGIVEIDNVAGDPFGVDALANAITVMLQRGQPLESLYREAMSYQASDQQLDDITLVEVTF